MKVARLKLFLLAIATCAVLAFAPGSASATIGANDVTPKPTVTGLPAATNLTTAAITLSTTVPNNWFVDFGCSFDSPYMTPCDAIAYPTCVPNGNQHTCTQSIARFLTPGTHTYRFGAVYCDAPTLGECELNDAYVPSAIETVTFVVERIQPVVTILGGPKAGSPVLKAGASSYTFTANEPVTFMCAFEGWAATAFPCASPLKVPANLANGSHRFVVYGFDPAGNRGAATRGFTVDVFHAKKCKKGSSKRAKAKRKKCVAKNVKDKKAWKKKHGLK